ncbi:MAG: indole-3-glycerol-phosphate synthase [Planctomycetes bacterium]|nr:indole-3-glycerol-phosphate synthase [Planctomycetota bacterium]
MKELASDFLAQMARASRARARRLATRVGRAELERRGRSARPPLPLVLAPRGFDLLAEVKFVSPAAGALTRSASAGEAAQRARVYAAAGACALSVLTEPTRFAGRLTHLAAAARAVSVPVLRKDFLVAPLQVLEARAHGASGVLLILCLLDDEALEASLAEARAAGLFVLLEAFDRADLERARRVLDGRARPPLLVGVNTRDLRTLQVDPTRLEQLAPHLPDGAPSVAESGITTPEHAHAAAALGYRLALVGSALMTSAAPLASARALLAAGRTGVRGGPR